MTLADRRVYLAAATLDRCFDSLNHAITAWREGRWEYSSIELTALMFEADDARALVDSFCADLDRGPDVMAAWCRWRLRKGAGSNST